MSLATYAYPFNSSELESTSQIEQIRKKRVKTQKKRYTQDSTDFDERKVNNAIRSLHQNILDSDSDSGDIGDFMPPPRAESTLGISGQTQSGKNMSMMDTSIRPVQTEGMTVDMSSILGEDEEHPQPVSVYKSNNMEANQYQTNYQPAKSAQEYYNRIMPGTTSAGATGAYTYATSANSGNDVLLQKINYMTHLLEDQKDEKTNNVTEEVILYSFLGIFIIFVADSFSKVGKYVR
jgi:hypothetical protein